jgi:hypothetical protein
MTAAHAPGTLRMTPGRWLALAIGVPVALSLIGFTGFDLVAQFGQASFGVDKTIPVRDGRLSLGVNGGDIAVRTARDGAARLAGTVRYSLIRPDITVGATTVSLGCRSPFGNCEFDGSLSVPPRTGVTLRSGGGDITVSGVGGGVSLSSDGGDITVSRVAGQVSAWTGGGDLTAAGLAGILRFSADGGDINGTSLASTDVNAQSGGGDVTLAFTSAPTSLVVGSDGGNITVLLPHNTDGYDVMPTTDGGNPGYHHVRLSSSSPDKITVDTGGGDLSITEAG